MSQKRKEKKAACIHSCTFSILGISYAQSLSYLDPRKSSSKAADRLQTVQKSSSRTFTSAILFAIIEHGPRDTVSFLLLWPTCWKSLVKRFGKESSRMVSFVLLWRVMAASPGLVRHYFCECMVT